MLEKTHRISIELSNLCNKSHEHLKCPLNSVKDKKILSSKIVNEVIDTCGDLSFKGVLAFHTYNEPLIDPRLFMFIDRAARAGMKVFIWTNGFYLDNNIIYEMNEVGVSKITVTAYTGKDYEYFNNMTIPRTIEYTVQRGNLDDRTHRGIKPSTFVERPDIHPIKLPCFAPLNEIMVRCNGKVGLCCFDCFNEYSFGDLHGDSFKDIISGDAINYAYKYLSKGDRYLYLCHNCTFSR